jgi:hypothetical protein
MYTFIIQQKRASKIKMNYPMENTLLINKKYVCKITYCKQKITEHHHVSLYRASTFNNTHDIRELNFVANPHI